MNPRAWRKSKLSVATVAAQTRTERFRFDRPSPNLSKIITIYASTLVGEIQGLAGCGHFGLGNVRSGFCKPIIADGRCDCGLRIDCVRAASSHLANKW